MAFSYDWMFWVYNYCCLDRLLSIFRLFWRSSICFWAFSNTYLNCFSLYSYYLFFCSIYLSYFPFSSLIFYTNSSSSLTLFLWNTNSTLFLYNSSFKVLSYWLYSSYFLVISSKKSAWLMLYSLGFIWEFYWIVLNLLLSSYSSSCFYWDA